MDFLIRKFILIKWLLARALMVGCVCSEGYARQLMFNLASISWANFSTYFLRKKFTHFSMNSGISHLFPFIDHRQLPSPSASRVTTIM